MPTKKRTFEYVAKGSNKFWSIEVNGTTCEINYGPRGAPGIVQLKTFLTPPAADAYAYTRIREKLKRGYVEVVSKNATKQQISPIPSVDPKDTKTKAAEAIQLFRSQQTQITALQKPNKPSTQPLSPTTTPGPNSANSSIKPRRRVII